jgi:poly-gamma-glutamate capsule biosynthesis protein CapA/YwtB (metallophosphatase superfamily)
VSDGGVIGRSALVIGLLAAGAPAARADWMKPLRELHDQAAAETIVLNAAGDIAYPDGWGGVDEIDVKQHKLFEQVQDFLDAGDLNFANIECPLTTIVPKVEKTYPIHCDPKRISYVLDAGFNLLSLANNHSLDAGVEGANDTRALLEEKRSDERPLWWAGTGPDAASSDGPTIFTIPGKKVTVAFFAVANTAKESCVASLYDDALIDQIKAASQQQDIVIVSVHNGIEYHHAPEADAVARYHSWIDAGADVVLGHHPHVVQGIERYGDGAIFYSLGNFSFGSRTVRHHETGARLYSMLGRVFFKDGKVLEVQTVPLYVNNKEAWTVGTATLAPVHATPQRLPASFTAAALTEFQDFAAAVAALGGSPTRIVAAREVGLVEKSDKPVAMTNPDACKVIAPPEAEKPAKKKLKGKKKAKPARRARR